MTVERSTTQVICLPDTRRVVRYRVDQVGNHLDAMLRWCTTHAEPVWVFGDDSYTCPYDLVTGVTNEHTLTTPPWEVGS